MEALISRGVDLIEAAHSIMSIYKQRNDGATITYAQAIEAAVLIYKLDALSELTNGLPELLGHEAALAAHAVIKHNGLTA